VPRRTNDDPIARAFGATIRAAREERELSLETVAGRIARTGRNGGPTTMDPKYLQAIEQGYHSPTISTALQIARALDMPLGKLVADL
jgi:transcriptional regulator with XRE-family HTH domain